MDEKAVFPPLEAEGWQVVREWARLDDLCDGIFDCPHTTPVLVENGPFVVRSQDIRGGIFRLDQAGRVDMATYGERIARAEPRHGDLFYSREGTYFGIAAEMPAREKVCLGQRMVLIRPKPTLIDTPFLRYWLNSPILSKHVLGFRDGTVAERLNMPTIRGIAFPLITLPEQRAIAATLGALDDKIELNRRMCETLESMARALFRDWFVDFGPTRAKMSGTAPYLAEDLWSLFPDRLDDHGKPEGWEVFTLGQIAEYHTKTITPAAMAGGEFEHFSLPAFDKGQSPALDEGETIKSNKTLIPKGAVLLSKLNPEISRVWLPENHTDRVQVCSTEFLTFTSKGSGGRALLFSLFSNDRFREMLQSRVTGTSKSHQRISPPSLLGSEVLLGEKFVLAAFEASAAILLEKVRACRMESRTLAETRDLLLPRLMSGALRVTDAEHLLEEVL